MTKPIKWAILPVEWDPATRTAFGMSLLSLASGLTHEIRHQKIDEDTGRFAVEFLESVEPGDRFVKLARRELDSRSVLARLTHELAGAKAATLRPTKPGSPITRVMVHPTPRPDAQGRYQITHFGQGREPGEDMPWGHKYAAAGGGFAEALREAWDDWGPFELLERANPPGETVSGEELIEREGRLAVTGHTGDPVYAKSLAESWAGRRFVLVEAPLEWLDFQYDPTGRYFPGDEDKLSAGAARAQRTAAYAAMGTPFPPIVVLFNERQARLAAQGRAEPKLWVRSGNHRCGAAALRGDRTIAAYVPEDDWERFMSVTGARRNPPLEGVLVGRTDPRVQSELPDAVERAIGAGAVPPLTYAGAGAQGIVLCDSTGRAFKVARTMATMGDFRRRGLRDEYGWLAAAGAHPATAAFTPRVYGLDLERGVLVRDCVQGEKVGQWTPTHEWERELRSVPGWLPPEGGADQWIMTKAGPKIVDGGFARRSGGALVRYVSQLLAGEIPWYDEKPKDLAWDLAMEVEDKRISPEVAAPLVRALRSMAPDEAWGSESVKRLIGENPPRGRWRWNPDAGMWEDLPLFAARPLPMAVAPAALPTLPPVPPPPPGIVPDLRVYDSVIVYCSGGKDSLASLVRVLELAREQGRDLIAEGAIELWHHDVDSPETGQFMDWPCTPAYVRALGEALRIPVYFSWKVGGYLRELERNNARTAPTKWQEPGGVVREKGGTKGDVDTRLKFPAVTADLSRRWCSAYLKIMVGSMALSNQARFFGKRTLTVSGERAEEAGESSVHAVRSVLGPDPVPLDRAAEIAEMYKALDLHGRGAYAPLEPDRTDLESKRGEEKSRRVDRWRPVHHWLTAEVWDAIRRWGIVPHPAYRAGFGRVSCAFCIFGSADQWATLREIMPAGFRRVAEVERATGWTIDPTPLYSTAQVKLFGKIEAAGQAGLKLKGRERVSADVLADALLVEVVDDVARIRPGASMPADVRQWVDVKASSGRPYHAANQDMVIGRELAVRTDYLAPIMVRPEEWIVPAGAFAEGAGPV